MKCRQALTIRPYPGQYGFHKGMCDLAFTHTLHIAT